MDRKDRITTLLKEYDTLRAESLGRINHRWQMLGLIGAIVAFVSAKDHLLSWGFVPVYAMVLLLLFLWVRSGFHLSALAARIEEIEKKVNDIAGETLLEWESRGRKRFFGRLMRRRKSSP
jgi:hypothetical protein